MVMMRLLSPSKVQPQHTCKAQEATLFLNIAFQQTGTMHMKMTGLPDDWVFRPAFDLELKQYTLLAYLQRVTLRFGEQKLYPYLHELDAHLNTLLTLRNKKEQLARDLSTGELLGFDPTTGKPIRSAVEEPELLGVVDAVIDFAIPGLRKAIDQGHELREEITGHIRFGPVGVQPLRTSEGWLMLRTGPEARIYSYTIPLVHEFQDAYRYRSVLTRYVGSYTLSLRNTFERIRSEFLLGRSELPVPATFAFESDASIPHIETFMPLAKQLLYEQVANRI
jgi:hypothetical protein